MMFTALCAGLERFPNPCSIDLAAAFATAPRSAHHCRVEGLHTTNSRELHTPDAGRWTGN